MEYLEKAGGLAVLFLGEAIIDEYQYCETMHGGGEDDQAGDIRVDLVRGQVGSEQIADEEGAERRHRERLDRPIDEQCDADAAPMLADFAQSGEVDLTSMGMIISQISAATGRLTLAISAAPIT